MAREILHHTANGNILQRVWGRFLRSMQGYHIFIFLVKWAAIIFSARYLYVHVIRDTRFADIYHLALHILQTPASAWLLAAGTVMVFANWGMEALKWKYLLRHFASISFIRSFSAVLSGNAISLWMPNRIGEYLGRIVFVDEKVRIKSAFATVVGSLAQLIVTLMLGAIGFIFYEKPQGHPLFMQVATAAAAVLFIGFSLFFYFNIKIIRGWLPRKKWAKPLRKYLKVYRQYTRQELETILTYSLIRYLVFSVQFYVFLVFFGVSIPFPQAMLLIFVMYFVQTISPTAGLMELVVRGGTTAFFFTGYTHDITAVLAASYSVWFINLLIPSLAGAVILGFARSRKKQTA